ncbi:hypothetical protein MferCBS31731_000600 [Microsporum ferrugineum]
MSRAIKTFKVLFFEDCFKIFKEHLPGGRILPSKTKKNDENAQFRIDAGEVINGRKNLYLQVNSEATNEALRKWLKKNGTHANIATGSIDINTKEEDKDTVSEELWNSFEKQLKDNLR